MYATDTAGHAVHRIARLEPRYPGTNRFDAAGEIDSEDCGQRLLRMSRLTGADLEIERIDAAGLDADQDLAGSRNGPCHLGEPEWCVGGIQDGRLHRFV